MFIRIFVALVTGICIGLLVATLLIPDQPDKVWIFTPDVSKVQTEPPEIRV